MTEKKPIPALTITALAFLNADYKRQVEKICRETLSVMDLKLSAGWRVDVQKGVVTREVPDEKQDEVAG